MRIKFDQCSLLQHSEALIRSKKHESNAHKKDPNYSQVATSQLSQVSFLRDDVSIRNNQLSHTIL